MILVDLQPEDRNKGTGGIMPVLIFPGLYHTGQRWIVKQLIYKSLIFFFKDGAMVRCFEFVKQLIFITMIFVFVLFVSVAVSASNYVWRFTTSDTTPPTVTFVRPADASIDMCVNKKITATFSEPMATATINTANFTLAGVTGTVAYDEATRIATFTPDASVSDSTAYTATISTGVTDLAGNALAVSKIWTFTTGITTCAAPVALGVSTPYSGFGGGAGMTNTGVLTVIYGDMGTTGTSNAVTGFHDSVGDIYTETGDNIGFVTGRIYTDAPPPLGAGVGGNAATFATATAVLMAAQTAHTSMSPASLPGGVDPGAGQLGGLTLVPGIYKAAASTFMLSGADLTLDGQGDPDAVWVFQSNTTLNIGVPGIPRNVILINNAKAKNVFWYVGSAARIEDRCNMVGTVIAGTTVTISTAGQLSTTTIDGRALALTASVTMVNTIMTMPAP